MSKPRKKFIPTTPSGKPFHLSTSEEVERRIQIVEGWLRRGIIYRSHLKKKIKEEWNVEHGQAGEYIRRARASFLLHMQQPKAEHEADSLAFYEGIITSKKTTIAEKLRARERIDKLLGLEQPAQIKLKYSTKRNGIPVDDLPLEEKRKLLKHHRDGLKKLGNGSEAPQARSDVK